MNRIENDKSYSNIYDKAISNYHLFINELIDTYTIYDYNIDDNSDNIISKQIDYVNQLFFEGNDTETIYRSSEEKKVLFKYPKDKIKREIDEILDELSIEEIKLFLCSIYNMYIYNRLFSVHIISFKAYGELYNLPIDDFCKKKINSFLKISNLKKRTELMETVESSLDKSNKIFLLLMSFILRRIKFETNDGNYMHCKLIEFDKIKYLLYKGFSLYHIVELEYDITVGIDRNLILYFDLDGELSFDGDIQSCKRSLSDYDYKMYDMNLELDEKLRNGLEREIKKTLGFNLGDLRKMINFHRNTVNMNNLIMINTKSEWISWIMETGFDDDLANKIFEYFSYSHNKGNKSDKFDFSDLVCIDQKIQDKFFLQVGQDNYLSSQILLNYGCKLLGQKIYNSPASYIENKTLVDRIANSFCSLIAEDLNKIFSNAIIINNLSLSAISESDREIDILLIYDSLIYIIECKRMAFPLDDIKVRSQYNNLLNKCTKQVNMQVKEFTSNKNKILTSLSENYSEIRVEDEYKVFGIIVTKEYSPAHDRKNTVPIVHRNELIEYLQNNLLLHKL